MKYLTQNWDSKYDGILFFIQRLEEMLFHYSDDIVKAPVHNTSTLIEEYCINEKDQSVNAFHLDIIASEIKDSLEKDHIIESYLGNTHIEGITKLLNTKQREAVHYLKGIVSTSTYYAWCKEYLQKNIIIPSHKREINEALRAWISSLSWQGYSLEYIYRKLHEIFEPQISDPEWAINNFIKCFDFESHDYRIYFIFLSNVSKYKYLLQKRLNITFEDDGCFEKIKLNNKSFIGYLDVKGIDPYQAKAFAYNKIDTFVSFYKVISNRKKPLLGKTSLVINAVSKEEMFIPVIIEGYRTIEIDPSFDIGKTIDYVILGCQTKSRESIQHLRKMLNLHNMAIAQADLYDGFVNLWSVLEVVSKESSIESKINAVIDSCLPILQNDYLLKYFESLTTDLKHSLSKNDYKTLINTITQKGNDTFKIMCFTFLDEYELLREDYFNKLSSFPNIRDKIYRMYMLRTSRKAVQQLSETYANRVRWHIYRLYRVRNGIVHGGERIKNIQVLGDHLHIYCDGVLNEIIYKFAHNTNLKTISDVLVDTSLLVNAKKTYFSSDGSITENDIKYYTKYYFE